MFFENLKLNLKLIILAIFLLSLSVFGFLFFRRGQKIEDLQKTIQDQLTQIQAQKKQIKEEKRKADFEKKQFKYKQRQEQKKREIKKQIQADVRSSMDRPQNEIKITL